MSTEAQLIQLEAATAREPKVRELMIAIGEALVSASIDPSRELGLALVHLGTEVLKDFGATPAERGEPYRGDG